MAANASPDPGAGDLCEQRGYHGPFTNQDVYDRYPEWQGMGDCVLCGLTRDVARHEQLRRGATRAA